MIGTIKKVEPDGLDTKAISVLLDTDGHTSWHWCNTEVLKAAFPETTARGMMGKRIEYELDDKGFETLDVVKAYVGE